VSAIIVRFIKYNMYKFCLTILAVFLFFPLAVFAADGDVSPSSGTDGIFIIEADGAGFDLYDPDMQVPSPFPCVSIGGNDYECNVFSTQLYGVWTVDFVSAFPDATYTFMQASTTPQVANHEQNLFNGLILYFMSFFFVVWFFRGKLMN